MATIVRGIGTYSIYEKLPYCFPSIVRYDWGDGVQEKEGDNFSISSVFNTSIYQRYNIKFRYRYQDDGSWKISDGFWLYGKNFSIKFDPWFTNWWGGQICNIYLEWEYLDGSKWLTYIGKGFSWIGGGETVTTGILNVFQQNISIYEIIKENYQSTKSYRLQIFQGEIKVHDETRGTNPTAQVINRPCIYPLRWIYVTGVELKSIFDFISIDNYIDSFDRGCGAVTVITTNIVTKSIDVSLIVSACSACECSPYYKAVRDDEENCPEGTCPIDCGDYICCYNSQGIAVARIEK